MLLEHMHPSLLAPNPAVVLREIGQHTKTSLRNNDYVQVQYENYAIETYDILSRLQTNNYTVEAYYLPDGNGQIAEVYLY